MRQVGNLHEYIIPKQNAQQVDKVHVEKGVVMNGVLLLSFLNKVNKIVNIELNLICLLYYICSLRYVLVEFTEGLLLYTVAVIDCTFRSITPCLEVNSRA